MSGMIYHTCTVCGCEMYPKLGLKSNGDTITEFMIEPCKNCASKSGAQPPQADNSRYAKCADDILKLDLADEVINKHGCLVDIIKRHFA